MKVYLQQAIEEAIFALQKTGVLPESSIASIQIDHTKDASHGDYASNIALVLSKIAKQPPRALAEQIVKHIHIAPPIKKIEIAGPGFINFFIEPLAHQNIIADILKKQDEYGRSEEGEGKSVIVEFVSANPTGPLHVGHGRGAAYGSAVSNLLSATGYKVHREYYVNDMGRQMDILAVSVWLRYLELSGAQFNFPSNGYRGGYIVPIAQALRDRYHAQFEQNIEAVFDKIPADFDEAKETGDKEAHIDALINRAKELLGKESYELVHKFGRQQILEDIREDLLAFRVSFDEWFSEKKLLESGAIEKGIAALRARGYIYEKDGALWFRSTDFGDEKDRVVIRSNGQTTYFASDIAYHWNKLDRRFERIIDIFGADHHGYVARVRAAVQALGLNADAIQIPLVQFAVLYRGTEKVQMSTRSGEFVTLRELREEVGNNATRFFYLMRKCDQHMDFDMELAKSQSMDNPVYYIQYAHARICSVFRQLEEKQFKWNEAKGLAALNLLVNAHEIELMQYLARYTEVVNLAARQLEPHHLTTYLRDLAQRFHAYYNAETFIVPMENLRDARLCLVAATRQVLINGLSLLGISAPEEM